MRKFVIFGAAAVVFASALAGPAMARETRHHHRHMAARTMPPQQADAGWNNNGWNNNSWDRGPTGFLPLDVAAGAAGAAAGVAGAAVGTAGAIATAPFRTADSYAYAPNGYNTYAYGPNGYYGDWNTYAARNGLVCRPGTWYKADDGRQHLCQ
jgi:hypothetical protein